jgi:hypothetical protein
MAFLGGILYFVQTSTKSAVFCIECDEYDKTTGAYVPFTINESTTCGELMYHISGLSLLKFSKLCGTASPNVIPLQKPS